MMKRETFEIARIYVPVKRRASLEPDKVEALAQDILANGLKNPILVRPDGERFVLVEGLRPDGSRKGARRDDDRLAIAWMRGSIASRRDRSCQKL
jgi:hypothetical protein